MIFTLILAVAIKELILKVVMSILLGFGSLLWTLSIVAVVWGFYDGLIPALHKRDYAKGAVILLILLVTCLIIVISLDKAVYLTAFILPISFVYLYIKLTDNTGNESITDFRNN